jgi:hypothetical protein
VDPSARLALLVILGAHGETIEWKDSSETVATAVCSRGKAPFAVVWQGAKFLVWSPDLLAKHPLPTPFCSAHEAWVVAARHGASSARVQTVQLINLLDQHKAQWRFYWDNDDDDTTTIVIDAASCTFVSFSSGGPKPR